MTAAEVYALPEVRRGPVLVPPAAAYLRATATNRPAGWDVELDDAARALFAGAFRLAVRRRFRPGGPIADVARTVANAARRHRPLALSPVALSAMEAEMLIRDVLGEAVPIEGIPIDRTVATHVVIFASIVEELALNDDELDELIAEALSP